MKYSLRTSGGKDRSSNAACELDARWRRRGYARRRFDSEADTIELTHVAKTRRGFALGALTAARWLHGRKGVFTMDDVDL
jgi:hypothetical protein